MKTILSASLMTKLLACPRAYYWRYEARLAVEKPAAALRFGSAWHRAMEARWQGKSYDEALASIAHGAEQLDELQAATVAGLLAGYYRHYAAQGAVDVTVAHLHPEIEFSYPLERSRSFLVAGKIDGLGVLHDGRLALGEHKTTSDDLSPGSDYWLRLRGNGQVLQYVLAARKLGWTVETVLYDVTRKPAIEPRTIPLTDEQGRKIVLDGAGQRVFKKNGEPRESGDKEAGYTLQTRPETPEEFAQRLAEDTAARPEFYFARREVAVLDADLAEFETHRLVLAQTILIHRRAQRDCARPEQAWPRHLSDFGCRLCEYASFCLNGTNLNLNQPPAGFRVSASAHPELEAGLPTP